MKKSVAFLSLVSLAGIAFATSHAVGTTGTATADNSTCAYISGSNTVTVKASQNVAAVYECSSTGVVTGAAHTQGKKHAYISSSSGGGQTEVGLSANPSDAGTVTGITGATEWSTAVTAINS